MNRQAQMGAAATSNFNVQAAVDEFVAKRGAWVRSQGVGAGNPEFKPEWFTLKRAREYEEERRQERRQQSVTQSP